MSAHLSTPGASSEPNAWQELEDVFSGLSRLARSTVSPHEFYQTLLDESVRSIHAIGGAVWLRASNGAFQPVVQSGWPSAEFARGDSSRRDHEALLASAASQGKILALEPRSATHDGEAANPTEHVLLLGPVMSPAGEAAPTTASIIELLLRAGASPATHRGCEQFLAAVCELAADYHSFAELRRLRQDDDYRAQLLRLSAGVHRQLDLLETAYAVANEGRRLIGCDRLSVVGLRRGRCRLLAASGVSRVERRSGAARRLEQVADMIRRTNEAAFYADGQCDALPQVAEALEQHAEESHARQVAAVPLRPASDSSDESSAAANAKPRGRRLLPTFVLVAEQFDARDGGFQRERLVEVAEVSALALYNAQEMDELPLGWLLRPLGEVKQKLLSHLPRTVLAIATIAAGVLALVFVPADFNIEAPGTLQPVVRQDVFAPRSGLVDEVLVAHGANVEAGQPLVRLRDPVLDLELKRVDGEIETVQRQIDAVRATRTNRAIRDANPTDAYRLSAEEREFEQRLTNLRRELELLNRDRQQLTVRSPIRGRVLSWDVGQRLVARPVERGEVLVTVADLTAEWQLELAVPDDRLGHVLAAQQALKPDLTVHFRLSSDDREVHTGHIAEISRTADVKADEAASPSPVVMVKVTLDDLVLDEASRRELRPGVAARAQIACGRRPIGYVWLHDLWDAAMEWLRF